MWQWIAPSATPNISIQQDTWLTFPEIVGEYHITLKVTDIYGCWDTITHKLVVEDDVMLFVPNTFTPNGDELNNAFRWVILGINESEFHIEIWNRWGQLIWESQDPYSYWDGTYNGQLVPDGSYSWVIQATNKLNAGKKAFVGTINIIK
jgi:gliding motility-associated-like protein